MPYSYTLLTASSIRWLIVSIFLDITISHPAAVTTSLSQEQIVLLCGLLQILCSNSSLVWRNGRTASPISYSGATQVMDWYINLQ